MQCTQETDLHHTALVTRGQRAAGCPLHKATFPRMGNVMTQVIRINKHRELSKMRRQRNMFQREEQDKAPEEETNGQR